MDKQDLEKLRFPIGRYAPGDSIGPDDVLTWVDHIRVLPAELSHLLEHISAEELQRQYRPGSWTVQQLVHHIADSHCNAYVRMKRTLTEDVPTIVPYDEKAWANLPDVDAIPLQVSLSLITAVHTRLQTAISDLSIAQLSREFRHADFDRPHSMAYLIGMYAWHGRHHLQHLRIALGKV